MSSRAKKNKPEPGDVVEAQPTDLAFGGKGVARVDGLAVFIERALPGSRVAARITSVKKKFAEAVVEEVLQPSPHAVDPFCPHFEQCGGCAYQRLELAEQLGWKRRQVAGLLQRIGGLGDTAEAVTAQVAPSPEATYYRNKMEFAFKGPAGAELSLGLRAVGDPDRIINVRACCLQSERSARMVNAVRELCRQSGLAAYDPDTGQGYWRFLVVRENRVGDGLVHLITADKPKHEQAAEEALLSLKEAYPQGVGFLHSIRRSRSSFAVGEDRRFQDGSTRLRENVCGLDISYSADAFFQTNSGGAELLFDIVEKAAKLTGTEVVWDLYCGVGVIGLYLAAKAKQVIGFESNSESVTDAEANARRNGVENATFLRGDALRLMTEAVDEPDVAVVDPPRSGLHEGVVRQLIERAPQRIVYVSCHPATMARDIKRLGDAYKVDGVTPADMFPHTSHVECVAGMQRLK